MKDKDERAEELCEVIPHQSLTAAHGVLQNFAGLTCDGVKNGIKWTMRKPKWLEKMIML